MLAEHDGRLLLGRQPHYPPGRYSALAGFVEAGETIEAAVARELHEEAGIAVSRRTLCRQPAVAVPLVADDRLHRRARLSDELTIDTTELDDARWFTRAEVAAALARRAGRRFPAAAALRHRPHLARAWLASAA